MESNKKNSRDGEEDDPSKKKMRLETNKPKQKRGAKEGSKYKIGKTVKDWVEAIELYKSIHPPMSQTLVFLKSSISGDMFTGSVSEQVSFSKRLKEYDKGKFEDKNLNVKKLQPVRFPDVERKLVRYLDLREHNYQQDKLGVDWLYLKNLASEFAEQLGEENFKASDGWLQNVLRRSNKQGIKLHGEAGEMSAEEIATTIEDWKKTVLHPMMEEFEVTPERCYNADQTGLFYQKLPNTHSLC